MLRNFLAAFLFGALLVVVVAWLYPLPEAPRLASESVALANGGSEEVFYIRLPDDRVGSPRGAPVAQFPTQAFDREGADQVLAELFRVRNSDGRVIGLASKMTGTVAEADALARRTVDWTLLLPGRGALILSTEGQPADESRSYPPGRMGLDPVRSGMVIQGTGQFDRRTGFFVEDVEVERTDASGQAYGVIQLRTRMQSL